MIRCAKYEGTRFSYWRSEERRRILGINGYEPLLTVSSGTLTSKVLHLLGQKYDKSSVSAIKKEIILIRKFMRETSLEQARSLKDFWGTFYKWQARTWPSRITSEGWIVLRREDSLHYSEEYKLFFLITYLILVRTVCVVNAIFTIDPSIYIKHSYSFDMFTINRPWG